MQNTVERLDNRNVKRGRITMEEAAEDMGITVQEPERKLKNLEENAITV